MIMITLVTIKYVHRQISSAVVKPAIAQTTITLKR